MIRWITLQLATLVGLFLLPQAAQGALATSLLITDGATVNKLEDVDREQLYDVGNDDTLIDVGDVLYGIWEVSNVNGTLPASVPADYFVASFALQVDKVQSSGGLYYFFFKALSDDTLFTTLTGKTRSNSGTVAIMYSDVNGINDASPSISDVSGTKLWEWGFSTAPSYVDFDLTHNPSTFNADIPDYFWVAAATTNDLTLVPAASGAVTYSAALEVLQSEAAVAGIDLLPFSQSHLISIVSQTVTRNAPVHLDGGSDGALTNYGTAQSPNVWLPTDTDIWVKPTPEPSTWIALIGLVLMGLAWRSRRSK